MSLVTAGQRELNTVEVDRRQRLQLESGKNNIGRELCEFYYYGLNQVTMT